MSNLNLNRVCLAGHMTRDPVLRKTAGGTAVADLGVAINETYVAKDGKSVQQACFVDVVAWGKTAEAVHAHLHKGDPLLVEGSLTLDQWETDKGEKRSRIRVRAGRVHFVGTRKANGDGAGGNGASGNGAATPAATVAEPSDDPIPF